MPVAEVEISIEVGWLGRTKRLPPIFKCLASTWAIREARSCDRVRRLVKHPLRLIVALIRLIAARLAARPEASLSLVESLDPVELTPAKRFSGLRRQPETADQILRIRRIALHAMKLIGCARGTSRASKLSVNEIGDVVAPPVKYHADNGSVLGG